MGRWVENLAGKAVAEKINKQFPVTPEGQLMSAVIRQAVLDASSKSAHWTVVSNARRYLAGDMPAAELCGVDSGWIRRVVQSAGLLNVEL